MEHWSKKYIGKEYIEGTYDCLDFVLEVLSKEYGIETCLIPNHGSCTLQQQKELQKRLYHYSEIVDKPEDGCAVLLRQGKRIKHLGIFYINNKVGYIIHNSPVINAVVQSVAYKIKSHGYEVDRYLKWSRK